MMLPDAAALALAGIGFVALFGAWKLTISPRLAARKTRPTPA